jgi:hypothetical protein
VFGSQISEWNYLVELFEASGLLLDEGLSAASKGSDITKQKSKIGVSMSFISSPVYS